MPSNKRSKSHTTSPEKTENASNGIESGKIKFGQPIILQYENFEKEGIEFTVGDFVMLDPPEEYGDNESKWIAQLSSIYESKDRQPYGVMKWLWRPRHVPSLRRTSAQTKELLITGEKDVNSLHTVYNKCKVVHKDEYKTDDNEDVFFCYKFYDAKSKELKHISKEEFDLWVAEDIPDSEKSNILLSTPGSPHLNQTKELEQGEAPVTPVKRGRKRKSEIFATTTTSSPSEGNESPKLKNRIKRKEEEETEEPKASGDSPSSVKKRKGRTQKTSDVQTKEAEITPMSVETAEKNESEPSKDKEEVSEFNENDSNKKVTDNPAQTPKRRGRPPKPKTPVQEKEFVVSPYSKRRKNTANTSVKGDEKETAKLEEAESIIQNNDAKTTSEDASKEKV